ncbi:MAG: alpha/beta hydrolase [Actinomycetota bacterium]|nr:alpha/beta hydrolase [Actinomycetota bacterium]
MKRLLLAAVVFAVLVGVPSPASASTPKLQKCDIGANKPFRCGHIRVPAVRGVPSLGKQKIGFAVRPRGDRSKPSLGAIVFVEGGPGYAATNFDSIKPMGAVFAPFLRRHELIAIDQRGTGLSSPLRCGELQRGRVPQQQALAACAKKLGPRYQGFTTAESAADVEAVRQAIGLPKRKMVLYGDSYGTYLGQSYAARYGEGMKGLILSSAYPGNDPYWRTLYPAALNAVKLACRRFPECRGNALGRFKRALKKVGVRSEPAGNILAYLVGDAATYAPNGYRNLNQAISDYLRGKPRPLRDLTEPGPPGSGPVRYFSEGLYAAVVCNDYPVAWDRASGIPERRHQLDRNIAAFRPTNLFAPVPKDVWMRSPASDIDACLTWPGPTARMEPPIPPGRKMPSGLRTLVVAGEFDSITSVKEARQVERRFPRGRLFVVPNRGHVSELYYPFESRATGRIRHFVKNLN